MFIRITIIDDNGSEVPTFLEVKSVKKFEKRNNKYYVVYCESDPTDGANFHDEIKNTLEEIDKKLMAIELLK